MADFLRPLIYWLFWDDILILHKLGARFSWFIILKIYHTILLADFCTIIPKPKSTIKTGKAKINWLS